MARVWIYCLGGVVLALCLAVTLPSRIHGLETGLRSQIEQTLSASGLGDIAITMDGQTATLSYREDAMAQVAASGEQARARMLRAAAAAESLSGGLPAAGRYGGILIGPVTRVTINDSSVTAMQSQLDAAATRAAMAKQAEKAAADCTDRVTKAVASRRLQFVSGSAELTGDSPAILNDIYTTIQACPDNLVLSVEGHTDDVGQEADNVTLSTQRAEAAALALIELGLPQAQVTSRGFGPADPIADNDDEDGRAKNRRVDFILRPRAPAEAP